MTGFFVPAAAKNKKNQSPERSVLAQAALFSGVNATTCSASHPAAPHCTAVAWLPHHKLAPPLSRAWHGAVTGVGHSPAFVHHTTT